MIMICGLHLFHGHIRFLIDYQTCIEMLYVRTHKLLKQQESLSLSLSLSLSHDWELRRDISDSSIFFINSNIDVDRCHKFPQLDDDDYFINVTKIQVRIDQMHQKDDMLCRSCGSYSLCISWKSRVGKNIMRFLELGSLLWLFIFIFYGIVFKNFIFLTFRTASKIK